MAAIMAGTVMVVLDTTIVNVALTAIGEGLHASSGIEWVVTAYLLGVCASQPACGWAADRFGRKEVYLASLVAFTATSLLASMASNLPELVVARALQGFGGGALLPVGMAICLDVFPRSQHGRAIAMWGTSAMVVPALGPTFGGWLVTAVSWNWLFRINVPIGVVCVILGIRLLPRTTTKIGGRLDSAGLVLGIVGLSLTVLGLSQGNSWGWGSAATIVCVGVGVGSSWWFVRHELAARQPLLDLRMLSHRAFRLTLIIVLFVKISEFGRLVYLALELTGVRGYTPLRVGLIFMPAALCTAFSMQVGGRMTDRLGPRLPILTGLTVVLVATASLGFLGLSTPEWLIVAILCVQGLGTGLTNAPVMVAGISQLPKEKLSQASALRTLTNQVAGAIAVAVLGAVVAIRIGTDTSSANVQAAYNAVFIVGAVGVAIGWVVAYRLPRGVPDLSEDDFEEAAVLALAGE
jgi:DHA2 family multidrug resistance protein